MHPKPSYVASLKPHQHRQPIQAAENPDALLTLQTVVAITGLSTSSIYRKLSGDFPQPIRMGARCTRWRAADVTAWLRKQAAQAKAA